MYKSEEKFYSLNSESAKKEAVKEQIKMRTDGLGWKGQCHHPWSKKGETYAADVLKKHLIETILPYGHKMKAENKIPKVPKVELPSSKIKNLKLGTVTLEAKKLIKNDEEKS